MDEIRSALLPPLLEIAERIERDLAAWRQP
jgi:hypothetical protein